LATIGREDDTEYEQTEIEIPPMKFFHISKPEIRIYLTIDERGKEGPYHKDTQYHEMFSRSSPTHEKENRRECHQSDEKEYFYFFKTSKVQQPKVLCYV